ncbi:MAG: iron chelate uptake ABC transporter family permease subunit [Alistipes sp.]|nr:iron chelate uptake ABC transporter family permease subunit [Alistipes sp.]
MKGRTTILFTLLSIALVVLFVADIAIGSVNISLRDTLSALVGGQVDSTISSIVIDIRLIKAIMALLAGAALSLSGLQWYPDRPSPAHPRRCFPHLPGSPDFRFSPSVPRFPPPELLPLPAAAQSPAAAGFRTSSG